MKTLSKIMVIFVAMSFIAMGSAQGDRVVYQTGVYDVFITDPVPVGTGAENLLSVDLYVVNTSGISDFDPKWFDGVYFGYSGITTATPLFHQHDAPPLFVVTPVIDNPFATAIDTHFLVTTPALTVITAPSETRGLAPSTEPTDAPSPWDPFADTTYGDELTGTFALTGPAPSTRWDLAQLVVPDGSRVFLDFFMTGGGPMDPGLDGVIQTDFVVPEPASAALLLAGAVGLLRPRKAQQPGDVRTTLRRTGLPRWAC